MGDESVNIDQREDKTFYGTLGAFIYSFNILRYRNLGYSIAIERRGAPVVFFLFDKLQQDILYELNKLVRFISIQYGS